MFRLAFVRFVHKMLHLFCGFTMALLRPEEFKLLSKKAYKDPKWVSYWKEFANELSFAEQEVLKDFNFNNARILVMGVGGGRESVFFAKKGAKVSAIDISEEMIGIAQENAKQNKVALKCFQMDWRDIHPQEWTEKYDLVTMFCFGYSIIPQAETRIKMLNKLYEILNDGGKIVLSLFFAPLADSEFKTIRFKVILQKLLFGGNVFIELGDRFNPATLEFVHFFYNKDTLEQELSRSRFKKWNISKAFQSQTFVTLEK